MFFTTCSADTFSGTDFCLIFAPSMGYDEPEILPCSTHRFCLTIADANRCSRARQSVPGGFWKGTSDRSNCLIDVRAMDVGVAQHHRVLCPLMRAMVGRSTPAFTSARQQIARRINSSLDMPKPCHAAPRVSFDDVGPASAFASRGSALTLPMPTRLNRKEISGFSKLKKQ